MLVSARMSYPVVTVGLKATLDSAKEIFDLKHFTHYRLLIVKVA